LADFSIKSCLMFFIIKNDAMVYDADNNAQLKNIILQDLDILIPWLKSRILFINYSKSKFIHFKRPNQNNLDSFISIGRGSNKMFACNSYDYLGLVIDEKLSWTPHIEKVSTKISPIIAILKKIRYSVDLRTLEIIYNSFINSHLTYLLPIWGSASNTRIIQSRTLQNRALKFMRFLPFDHPTANLYSQKQLSLCQLYHFESILLIYKMIHNTYVKVQFSPGNQLFCYRHKYAILITPKTAQLFISCGSKVHFL
jgi:hypothetical protein